MGDTVFYLRTQLCKSLLIAIGSEDGIVTESLITSFLADNLSLNDSLKTIDFLLSERRIIVFFLLY